MSRLTLSAAGIIITSLALTPAQASSILDAGTGLSLSTSAAVYELVITCDQVCNNTLTSSTSPGTSVLNSAFPNQSYYSPAASAATQDAGATAYVDVYNNSVNMGLHGLAEAVSYAPSPSEGSTTYVVGQTGFDVYWDDSLTFGGVGPETYQYTLVLNALASASYDQFNSGTQASGTLSLYADSSYQGSGDVTQNSDCGSSSGLCGQLATVSDSAPSSGPVFVTGEFTVMGGSTMELGEYMSGMAYVSATGPGEATFNASDTGYLTLTPITAGASFTSDSGLTYATSPDAPEPATILLAFIGIAGIVGSSVPARRRVFRTAAV